MALKWNYQSTSNTQALYAAALRDMSHGTASSAPTLTSGGTGTFGGTYLDVTASPYVEWPGLDNTPVGSSAFTILIRGMPISLTWPNCGLFSFCNTISRNSHPFGGVNIGVTTAGKVQVEIGNITTSSGITGAFSVAPAWTIGTMIDLWITSTGTTAANGVQLWTALNGASPTVIASQTLSVAQNAYSRSVNLLMNLECWSEGWVNSNFHINEIAIFDSVINPATAYGTRTGFIWTGAAFEGYDSSDPGVANVTNGTAYQIAGTALTGTYVEPTVAQVESGVAFGAASALTGTYKGAGFNTDPGVANVANGTVYEILGASLTGTQGATTDPGVANVRSGTTYDISGSSKTGTLAVPIAADVLLGVSVDAGTGTRDDAIPATVLNNIVYAGGAKTGTLSLATSSQAAAILAVLGVANSDIGQLILELWQTAGLDSANPMTVTPSKRTVAAITMDLSGDGVTSTTVARQ